jgi:flagellar biosynthesis protein FlhG
LADADPGGGDVADFLPVEPLPALPDGRKPPQEVAEMLRSGPAGLYVLPAASAPDFLSGDSAAALGPLARPLHDLTGELDFVVADAGSGPTPSARQLWEAADLALLVTTSDPVSVMTTYGSVKALVSAGRSVPVFALVNRTRRRSAARQTYRQLARACGRFLAIRLGKAGPLRDAPQAGEAREAGEPLVMRAPRSRIARRLGRVAKRLIRQTERSAATR